MRGDLFRVARLEPGRLHGRVPHFFPPLTTTYTISEFRDDRRMMAPAARMISLYSGWSSKKDDFR
jgi:hypothetical protein